MIAETASQPYARMQVCKPHWIKFNRCVKRRDELILRSVRKWESEYFSALDEPSRKEYVDDLDTKMRYFLYAASRTPDDAKKNQARGERAALCYPPGSTAESV